MEYRTACNYRRECNVVAIVITVGNDIIALCICGNDAGNYGFSKIIIFATIITFGTVCNERNSQVRSVEVTLVVDAKWI